MSLITETEYSSLNDAAHDAAGQRDRFSVVDANATARVAPIWVTQPLPRTEVRGDIQLVANIILLAACRADEVAFDGARNGAFTGALLANRKDGTSWRDWMEATSRYMSEHHPRQHPALIEVSGAGLADTKIA